MKQKCKVCGVNAESEYCFRHKKKKPLPFDWNYKLPKHVSLKSARPPVDGEGVKVWLVMRNFFMGIWNKRPHVSEVSPTFLGHEPLSVFFHHILPKSDPKYKHLMYDEENIILLTLEEHESVELNMYKYEEINKRREKLLIKHGFQDTPSYQGSIG